MPSYVHTYVPLPLYFGVIFGLVIFIQMMIRKNYRSGIFVLLCVILIISSALEIHTMSITAHTFDCRYLITQKDIHLDLSRIRSYRVNPGHRYTRPSLSIQTIDGNSISIETDDTSRIAATLRARLRP